MDWVALLAFVVSAIVVFLIGRRFGQRSAAPFDDFRKAPFKTLHRHIRALEAALKDASAGAPIEQTRKGIRVKGVDIKLITGGRRFPSGRAEMEWMGQEEQTASEPGPADCGRSRSLSPSSARSRPP